MKGCVNMFRIFGTVITVLGALQLADLVEHIIKKHNGSLVEDKSTAIEIYDYIEDKIKGKDTKTTTE
jgi:hypothetical protein